MLYCRYEYLSANYGTYITYLYLYNNVLKHCEENALFKRMSIALKLYIYIYSQSTYTLMLLLIKVLYFTTQRKYLIAINVYEDRLLVRANT